MVRAGVVGHPREWDWCGCQELLGLKKRNRLVDMEALLSRLGDGVTLAGFRSEYERTLEEALAVRDLNRDPRWTESLAVGGREFVEDVGRQIPNRMEVVTGGTIGTHQQCRIATNLMVDPLACGEMG
jgi:putative transposase